MNGEVTRETITDLCERAVKEAELCIALCPDQEIALDMVDVVRNVLKHRVKEHWKTLRKNSKKSAQVNAEAFASAICDHVKEKLR